MNVRILIAAAVLAAGAAQSNAAIGDPPFAIEAPDTVNFPRPMPGAAEQLDDFWQTLRDWLQPKLGHVLPTEKWI